MSNLTPITVARGDGIGPEIMDATLSILSAAGAAIKPEFIDIGESQYLSGHSSGIAPSAWKSLRRTRVFLKAPITTPQGGGFKSLNVTIRKTLGLYANVRPCVSYAPFIPTLHPDMNVVIVRENEEDLYAGIEHRQTDDVYQCLKLITRPGCERIVKYAFDYAERHGRKHVTCMTKDNIMKMTDGLFHRVFDEIATHYPSITTNHLIIDIGAAKLATRPAQFDVIVTPNLYGDILSDIAAELTGSVGLAPSANIGQNGAMFEAIHGSAPDIAGQGIANPSGLLLAAVLMLVHIGQPVTAATIHNAWLSTVEDSVHTPDLHRQTSPCPSVSTAEFAKEVIKRLGQVPNRFKPVSYLNHNGTDHDPLLQLRAQANNRPIDRERHLPLKTKRADKQLVGVDVFVHHSEISPDDLADQLSTVTNKVLELQMITNRGVKVWPDGFDETFCTDHWRCRFTAPTQEAIGQADIVTLLKGLTERGVDVIKTEYLCTFNGARGYALGQGQ